MLNGGDGAGVTGALAGTLFLDFSILFDFGSVSLITLSLNGSSGKRICAFCWFSTGGIVEGGFSAGSVGRGLSSGRARDPADGDRFREDPDRRRAGGSTRVPRKPCRPVRTTCRSFGSKKGEFGSGEDRPLEADLEACLSVRGSASLVEEGGELLLSVRLLDSAIERSILFPSNPSRGGSESVQMFLGQNGQRRPFTIIIRGCAQPSGTGAQRSGGQPGCTSGPIRWNSC